jgi:hypothetical protein
MDASLITTLPAIITSLGGLIAAIASMRKAKEAAADAAKSKMEATEAQRRAEAAEAAFRHFDAHNQAVVLVLTYPRSGLSAVPLMRVWGWRIAEYTMQEGELLPDTDEFRADLRAADAVVLQGTTVAENAAIMRRRDFRDVLGGGVGVVSVVPDAGTRYDQSLFGLGDQSTTTPPTTEAAVRASIARAAKYRALQGVRPGGIAAAKAALPAA